MCMCMSVCTCEGCPHGPEEGIWFLGDGVTEDGELFDMGLETSMGLLQEQQALLLEHLSDHWSFLYDLNTKLLFDVISIKISLIL